MNFNAPFAIPALIPGNANFSSCSIGNVYPDATVGPYTTWKLPVRVATTANVTLSGIQTIDGILLISGNRILVKDQTIASQNGIYEVNSQTWQRTQDQSLGSNCAGTIIFVSEGTISNKKTYMCTNLEGSDIIGTNNIVYQLFTSGSGSSPGGINGSIQYNDSGTLGGSSSLIYDPSAIPANPPFQNFNLVGKLTIGNNTDPPTPPIDPKPVGLYAPDAIPASGNTGNYLVISAGNGDTNGEGGGVVVFGGYGPGTGGSGSVAMIAGVGSPTGSPGFATLSAGDSQNSAQGGSVSIFSGFNTSNGKSGDIYITCRPSTSGNGGDVNISSGGGASSGKITLTVPANSSGDGGIELSTKGIVSTFLDGGLRLVKSEDTVANLTTTTFSIIARQGILKITDPSLLSGNSSIVLTVNCSLVQTTDIINLSINRYNGANGVPYATISSVTAGVSFNIKLYNVDSNTLSNSPLWISFVLN